MTSFFNAYKNMFISNNGQFKASFKSNKPNRQKIVEQFNRDIHHTRKKIVIDRKSEANQQFEREVLPKLTKDYSSFTKKENRFQYEQQQKFKLAKLSLNPEEYSEKKDLRSPIKKHVTFSDPIKRKTYTQPRYDKIQQKNEDLNQKIEKLQKQYMQNFAKSKIKEVFVDEPTISSSRARQPSYFLKYPQKWQTKIIPNVKHKILANDRRLKTQGAQQNSHITSLIYLQHDNPYQFVNFRLDEIKKAQKYRSRGYINEYRDAIYRRRGSKNKLEERRHKLKNLLLQQEAEYAPYHKYY